MQPHGRALKSAFCKMRFCLSGVFFFKYVNGEDKQFVPWKEFLTPEEENKSAKKKKKQRNIKAIHNITIEIHMAEIPLQ